MEDLLTELRENQLQYESQLGKRYAIYEEYLNHLIVFYDAEDNRLSVLNQTREEFLSTNLIKIMDTTSVSFMICGAYHAMFMENDDWFLGFPYTSMVATAKKVYPNQILSIVTQYYERKIFRLFPADNLLNDSMKSYVKLNPEKYLLFDEKEIDNHPYANERCDMIIIQNKEFKIARNGKVQKKE